jgi:ABC-2 type transport system ATP-binding protein
LAADGTAVCYSTHYLPEVEALAASVAILERGRIIARGEVRELVRAHGTCAVELTFADDGKPLPRLRTGHRAERTDSRVLRVFTAEPGEDVSRILDGLGRHRERLRSLEIVTPSLESVFLALTGRRYEPETTGAEAVTEEVA